MLLPIFDELKYCEYLMVQAGVVSLPFLADLIHENGLFWPLLDNLVNCLRVYFTFKPTNARRLEIFQECLLC